MVIFNIPDGKLRDFSTSPRICGPMPLLGFRFPFSMLLKSSKQHSPLSLKFFKQKIGSILFSIIHIEECFNTFCFVSPGLQKISPPKLQRSKKSLRKYHILGLRDLEDQESLARRKLDASDLGDALSERSLSRQEVETCRSDQVSSSEPWNGSRPYK